MAGSGGTGRRNGGEDDRTPAGRLAREVSTLHARLLEKLRKEMPDADVDAYARAAKRLAEAFGAVTAAAVEPFGATRPESTGPESTGPESTRPESEPEPEWEALPSLYRPGNMRRRLDQLIESHRRYGYPFCLAVFDVSGPAARNGHAEGAESALAVVAAALSDSVRLVDETFSLEEGALCVLAPNQNTVGGVQMSARLLQALEDLEAAGGLPVEIAAGVAACPEHGVEADALLRSADEAMWRARALGQPVGVGILQDR